MRPIDIGAAPSVSNDDWLCVDLRSGISTTAALRGSATAHVVEKASWNRALYFAHDMALLPGALKLMCLQRCSSMKTKEGRRQSVSQSVSQGKEKKRFSKHRRNAHTHARVSTTCVRQTPHEPAADIARGYRWQSIEGSMGAVHQSSPLGKQYG